MESSQYKYPMSTSNKTTPKQLSGPKEIQKKIILTFTFYPNPP